MSFLLTLFGMISLGLSAVIAIRGFATDIQLGIFTTLAVGGVIMIGLGLLADSIRRLSRQVSRAPSKSGDAGP